MNIGSYTINIESPEQGFTLIPVCCPHHGIKGHNAKLFGEFLVRAKEPDVYVLNLGDDVDIVRTTARELLADALTRSKDDTAALMDDLIAEKYYTYLDLVKPSMDRCIGWIRGNHNWVWLRTHGENKRYTGESATQWMANQLNIPYYGDRAFIRLKIRCKKPRFEDEILISATHDYKSSATTAPSVLTRLINKVEPNFDSDWYFIGHHHIRISHFNPKLALDHFEDKFRQKVPLVLGAGSFLEGYVAGEETYVSQGGLRPTCLGWIEVSVQYPLLHGKRFRRTGTFMYADSDIVTVRR